MDKLHHSHLSRRERQIMDIIYQRGEASVADVLTNLPDPPGYNSVRVLLRILEDKGYLSHRQEGQRYIYLPTVLPEKAKRSELERLLRTFFEDSTPKVMSALLDISASKMSEKELDELSQMVEQAKKEREE